MIYNTFLLAYLLWVCIIKRKLNLRSLNSGFEVSQFVIRSGDQDKSMFDFRNWQDPGPSVKCHPLHDFCGLPKRDFIISAVMTPS